MILVRVRPLLVAGDDRRSSRAARGSTRCRRGLVCASAAGYRRSRQTRQQEQQPSGACSILSSRKSAPIYSPLSHRTTRERRRGVSRSAAAASIVAATDSSTSLECQNWPPMSRCGGDGHAHQTPPRAALPGGCHETRTDHRRTLREGSRTRRRRGVRPQNRPRPARLSRRRGPGRDGRRGRRRDTVRRQHAGRHDPRCAGAERAAAHPPRRRARSI